MILAICAIVGCKKDDNNLNTTVTPVSAFFIPLDSASYNLNQATSVLFEWAPAQAADGNLVQYIIAFDKLSGDFSSPIYEAASDGNGLYNRATLTKEVLNRICRSAGIDPDEIGEFKWTVYSTKGVNKVSASVQRLVKIQRSLGLDNPPSNVFIAGSASETGEDLTKAIKLKQTGDGKYEIYTSLKAGDLYFTDNNSDNAIKYFISGNAIREGDGVMSVAANKVYRIELDFNVLTAKMTEIKEVGLWFAPDNKTIFNLTYDKNGVWRASNKQIVFHQETWGRDERYKFRFTVNDGVSDSYEFWGSINSDNSRPTTGTDPSFWYLYPVNSNSYDYCFKFLGETDNTNCKAAVYMSPDLEHYTHEVLPE